MASPILGILFAAILAQSQRLSFLKSLAWLPVAIGAGAAVIAAWALRGQSFETVIGNWVPISFTGAPLTLAAFTPSLGVVIAWVTVYFVQSLHLPNADPFAEHPAASSLIVASLTITALSNNLITMLVGLGLTDLLSAYLALRRQRRERATLIGFVVNGLSISLLLVVVAVHYASGNSLHLPLARLSPSTAPLLALAIALRLGFVPFRTSSFFLADLRMAGSSVGGFLVLIRLPALDITQLPVWFYALAFVSAMLTLTLGILRTDVPALIASVTTASAYLASTTSVLAVPGATAAAVVAWLLGATLLMTDRASRDAMLADNPSDNANNVQQTIRMIGGLCLIGLPLTAGFVGYAGVTATWAGRGVGGLLLVAVWVVVIALFAWSALRVIVTAEDGARQAPLLTDRRGWFKAFSLRAGLGWLALLVPLVVFGIAPGLLEAGSFGEVVGRNGIVGWVSTGGALAISALLWRSQSRWLAWLRQGREQTIAKLEFNWFYDLLGGAVSRLRAPFSQVFTFLESDGALLWAVIFALLLVLIARPGGP